jgi:hypothetical protein
LFDRTNVEALNVLEHVLHAAAVDDGFTGMEAVEHVGIVCVGAVAEADGRSAVVGAGMGFPKGPGREGACGQ